MSEWKCCEKEPPEKDCSVILKKKTDKSIDPCLSLYGLSFKNGEFLFCEYVAEVCFTFTLKSPYLYKWKYVEKL